MLFDDVGTIYSPQQQDILPFSLELQMGLSNFEYKNKMQIIPEEMVEGDTCTGFRQSII